MNTERHRRWCVQTLAELDATIVAAMRRTDVTPPAVASCFDALTLRKILIRHTYPLLVPREHPSP